MRTVRKSTENRDHAQKISWNQLFRNFFSKNVDLTEKCRFSRKIRTNRSRFIVLLFHTTVDFPWNCWRIYYRRKISLSQYEWAFCQSANFNFSHRYRNNQQIIQGFKLYFLRIQFSFHIPKSTSMMLKVDCIFL